MVTRKKCRFRDVYGPARLLQNSGVMVMRRSIVKPQSQLMKLAGRLGNSVGSVVLSHQNSKVGLMISPQDETLLGYLIFCHGKTAAYRKLRERLERKVTANIGRNLRDQLVQSWSAQAGGLFRVVDLNKKSKAVILPWREYESLNWFIDLRSKRSCAKTLETGGETLLNSLAHELERSDAQ
jgi:hypothetical protein